MICINCNNMWDEAMEHYVFQKHCNQVFFYPYVLDRDWWFLLRHGPRLKYIFKKNNAIMPSEENNQSDDNIG
jgi:hypothetical protein